ncbi:myelin-associated glycoprotein-like [Archocentrus centrarchus]|uniref:myelin-associated glycoprotein-like n=1 Tax=Archocentrus centrarchus TaxID=63155 RepID=UPI0011EA3E5E|nr:myelin-associated glycoprotein-like [Archocentrus centrarchus]
MVFRCISVLLYSEVVLFLSFISSHFVVKFITVAPTEASSWTINVPPSVKGLLGSCVVIPCTYNYPNPPNEVQNFTGIWYDGKAQAIYHSDASQILEQFRNRTQLLGDISKKNCTLMIDNLQQSDGRPFYFRIEIKGYDQYSYLNKKVPLSVNELDLSVQEELKEGQTVSASCSVSHSCPTYPLAFHWSHSGEQRDQTKQLHEGQWNSTSTLTFHPNRTDHNKPLQCRVTYHGGKHQETSQTLKVKYAPEIKASSKCSSEGDTVKCECIVESEPPSTVLFVLADRILQSSKVEKNGSVTTETLQTDSGSVKFVHCVAINVMGNANLMLPLPVNDNMQNVFIASGAGVIVLIILIGTGVGVKKCRGRSGHTTSNLKSDTPVEPACNAPTKRKRSRKDIPCPDIYISDRIYGNTDWDQPIYNNV